MNCKYCQFLLVLGRTFYIVYVILLFHCHQICYVFHFFSFICIFSNFFFWGGVLNSLFCIFIEAPFFGWSLNKNFIIEYFEGICAHADFRFLCLPGCPGPAEEKGQRLELVIM